MAGVARPTLTRLYIASGGAQLKKPTSLSFGACGYFSIAFRWLQIRSAFRRLSRFGHRWLTVFFLTATGLINVLPIAGDPVPGR